MVTQTVFNQPMALAQCKLLDGNAAMRSALAFNALALRLARAFDRPDDAYERVMARLRTPGRSDAHP